MMSFALRCLFLALPVSIKASSTFLQRSQPQQLLSIAQDRAILDAIGSAISEEHREATEQRLAPIETLLSPTLAALPRNEYGRFGHKSVRLALHRLFVQRHAWFVKGIELDGNGNSTPTSILQGNVPEHVQSLFEERLGAHGLADHEVAVMAATLEKLANDEAMERLDTAYEVAKVAHGSANITVEQADSVLDVYMAGYITKLDLSEYTDTPNAATKLLAAAKNIYPTWGEVVDWVRSKRQETTDHRLSLSSKDVSDTVTRIGDQYGRWQAWECRDLKRSLLEIEDDGTGRVSLHKFYDRALNHGQWQFTESVEYLESLGALDMSNPANPRVIITNYVLSPSNCVASSKYYSVCCIDECEDLIGHLEQEIRAPVAEPDRIAGLVAALASPTTPANRTLPAQLLRRLDEIAADNGGVVSLHGRLFAQWMHHAYPRECPFPHVSGTIAPSKSQAYVESTGNDAIIGAVAMEDIIHDIKSRRGEMEDNGADEGITWSSEDELYVERPALPVAPEESSTLRTVVRLAAFGIPVFSTIAFLLHMDRSTVAEADGANRVKFHV